MYLTYTIEKLSELSSLVDFGEQLEKVTPRIMKCERCNILICDTFNKKLTRTRGNNETIFSLQRGLAGSAVSTKRAIISNNIQQEKRFV